MMKLAWGLIASPDALWVQILKRDGFTVRLWQDSFVSVVGPLLSSIPNGVFLSQANYPVAAFANNGSWKREEFQDLLPSDVLCHLASIRPPSSYAGADKPIWKLEPNGTFSIKSAYNFLQDSKSIMRVLRYFPLVFELWESIIDPKEWHSFFSLGLSQWLHRNQFIFQHKSELPGNLYFSIIQYARRIVTAAASPGPTSCGGLIRNLHGDFIAGFSANLGVCTTVKTELWEYLTWSAVGL
ncbi:hypothetical protein SESBI_42339 [Sesbania bispinosa]|nr:hypothetical protein SESBI_42339 [Sesbania bispinosa]